MQLIRFSWDLSTFLPYLQLVTAFLQQIA